MYDFKDSKTSGVVVVTKTWEDSLSNEERPVPDISISTEKPTKSPLGYTITYHGNGLTFSDRSKENEIIVNSSGKIVSGQYEELLASSGWYSDSNCINKIELNSDGLPVSGITSDLDLYAKPKTFVLKKGSDFNKLIPSTATSVVFTDEMMPASATLIDVDADGDDGVVAWMDKSTMKISTQAPGQKIYANSNSILMFADKSNLTSIDFHNLDTSKVSNMSGMFQDCTGLTNLNIDSFNTSNTHEMNNMFYNCSNLKNLNLVAFDTSKVESTISMFEECSSLTSLDLSMLDFSKVKDVSKENGDGDYSSMFKYCSALTSLKLPKMSNKITNMASLFSGCKSLTRLELDSLDTSNVNNMSGMFESCRSLINLDLSTLNTSNVLDMSFMFYYCRNLTEINLTSLDTSNVANMDSMFQRCFNLTQLDLSSFNTDKVNSMDSTFNSCSKLTNLSIGDKFTFIGSDYDLPEGTWYASDGTAYTSITIPNNKADTYTRK